MNGYLIAIGLVAAVGVGVWSVRWLVTRRLVLVTVRGASMEPTFADGERVLVSKTKPWRDGDVAVFGMPEHQRVDDLRWLVKRVAGIPGEPVPADLRSIVAEEHVPAGFLVVRGDGARSLDSRQLGLIPQASVLGVVIYPVRPAPAARL